MRALHGLHDGSPGDFIALEWSLRILGDCRGFRVTQAISQMSKRESGRTITPAPQKQNTNIMLGTGWTSDGIILPGMVEIEQNISASMFYTYRGLNATRQLLGSRQPLPAAVTRARNLVIPSTRIKTKKLESFATAILERTMRNFFAHCSSKDY